MTIDQKIIGFVNEHKLDDIQKLLLNAGKYPDIDVKLAVRLITAKKVIDKKMPVWQDKDGLFFPNKLSVEQSSSQSTAEYKKRFVKGDKRGVVLDITGGLGVDSFFLSQSVNHLFYFERNKDICDAAIHNFKYLNINNITISNIEISKESISKQLLFPADLIYMDPSRRDNNQNRIFAITDYQPNILELKDDLFKLSDTILIKVSPMVDISATIEQISEVTEVHVLSVNNECKELLFLLGRDCNNSKTDRKNIKIFTTNFCKNNKTDIFNFNMGVESDTCTNFSGDELMTYLYEPNSSILKAGAFKSISTYFDIFKLHDSTHLYTNSLKISDFPGRRFVIKEQMDFKRENIRNFRDVYPKANVSTRNFPLTPEELKKTLKISDGGELYVFGCTVFSGAKKILVCTKEC